MNFDEPGLWWLAAAAALGIAELLVPGVFLVFLALAAAIVGVATLALPDLSSAAQLGAFAVWSAIIVLIGKRWYRDYPVETSDPMLNDRLARLIGARVTVVEAIDGGRGRVRVGDGEWPASGPDLPVGAQARIVGASGTLLTVEPFPPGDR
ncbi:NfeD family protein [Sphingomonas sp.]|uniref:NfeD family protein n=1 Tax=Sphingomonas sp. TaxID=28214 RepID=UPI0035C87CC2